MGGLVKPASVDEFVRQLQWHLDNGGMMVLDPTTDLELTHPVTFTLRGGWSWPNGLSAYGARFRWKTDGDWTRTMFTFKTAEGEENHYFTLRGLGINGDQTGGAQASPLALLRIEARSGAAIRGAQIDDLCGEGCQTGIWVEGEVFESYINRPRLSWCRNAGIVCRHGYDIPGVLSNIYITQPNITRCSANMGAAMGIHCDGADSVLVSDGNFISLDGPGIKATHGVKRIRHCDFENVGNVNGVAIEIDSTNFWSQVIACEGSNTQGNMPYLLWHGGDPSKLDHAGCRMYDGDILAPSCPVTGHKKGHHHGHRTPLP